MNRSTWKYFTIWVQGKVPSIECISSNAWFFFLLDMFMQLHFLPGYCFQFLTVQNKIWAGKAENIQLKCSSRADINNQTLTPNAINFNAISMQLNFCVQQKTTCLDSYFPPSAGCFMVIVRSQSSWRWLCSVSCTNFTPSTLLVSDRKLGFQYVKKPFWMWFWSNNIIDQLEAVQARSSCFFWYTHNDKWSNPVFHWNT